MPNASHQQPASLVVFSDDWGRHPSSCQHLTRQLLPQHKVLWVNTIGTRTPKLDLATFRRVAEKLKQWTSRNRQSSESPTDDHHHQNLQVANPRMWPWFTRAIDRRINRNLLTRQLNRLISQLPKPVTAITTLPVTADLPGQLCVDRWVYYCVDDFSQWPGLDGSTLRRMDQDMIRKADDIVAVSQHLQSMIANDGRSSSLLTHGVDLDHWRTEPTATNDQKPTIVFWGVVDRRLDTNLLKALSHKCPAADIRLIGPHQDPDPDILSLPNVSAPGPQPFNALPSIAAQAAVLVMPYADLPVTRAMQPLKMKEYMATGRPVVVSSLPAVSGWDDCLDVASDGDTFANIVAERIETDIPAQQLESRSRLDQESWAAKAHILESHLAIPADTTARFPTQSSK